MQLFLDSIGRLLMALLAVMLAQLGLSIEPESTGRGREVERTPSCVVAMADSSTPRTDDC